jgi:prevent-host-death family protein
MRKVLDVAFAGVPFENFPHVSMVDARNNLSELVSQAAYGHRRTILTRGAKQLAALVPIEDLRLTALLEVAEFEMFRSSLYEAKHQGLIPWEDIGKPEK